MNWLFAAPMQFVGILGTMAKNEKTSKSVAKTASKLLKDPKSKAPVKKVAAAFVKRVR
jgi:hypothetical protein